MGLTLETGGEVDLHIIRTRFISLATPSKVYGDHAKGNIKVRELFSQLVYLLSLLSISTAVLAVPSHMVRLSILFGPLKVTLTTFLEQKEAVNPGHRLMTYSEQQDAE